MPFFHRDFFTTFGCSNKYTQSSNDLSQLTCPKQDISSVWEPNVGVQIDEQTHNYGCLNQRCCVAMISFVKGKFNFLAAFCIVALIFILVAIMNARYMYKKIRKFNTRILSHRRDDTVLVFMVIFTVILALLVKLGMPEGPKGMPQPAFKEVPNINGYLTSLSDERVAGIGALNEEGWWNFDRIDLFKSLDDSYIFEKYAKFVIKSTPLDGEFRVELAQN